MAEREREGAVLSGEKEQKKDFSIGRNFMISCLFTSFICAISRLKGGAAVSFRDFQRYFGLSAVPDGCLLFTLLSPPSALHTMSCASVCSYRLLCSLASSWAQPKAGATGRRWRPGEQGEGIYFPAVTSNVSARVSDPVPTPFSVSGFP